MQKSSLKLSILDQSFVRDGMSAREALDNTVDAARLADELGFYRFWVSEHHNTKQIAGSAPELLMVKLADQTQRLRIGSGGIMLPNHSTLKVAENFRLLETLFPGRIDLGMGRAPGSDAVTHQLLNTGNPYSEQGYISQLEQLQLFFNDTAATQHGPVVAVPQVETVPAQWILSTSGGSAKIAAQFGMGLAMAQFIGSQISPDTAAIYRKYFQPSKQFPSPQALLCITLLCAETEQEVEQLVFQNSYMLLQLQKGNLEPPKDFADIKDAPLSHHERAIMKDNESLFVAGTPNQIKAKLYQLADEYAIDEIMMTTLNTAAEHRLTTFSLLAEVLNL